MSKIWSSAPKPSLRNRSPRAWFLVAGNNNQLHCGLLVETKYCACNPFEGCFAMSNNSDFRSFTILQVKLHTPGLALQFGPMPEGYVSPLNQPGMSQSVPASPLQSLLAMVARVHATAQGCPQHAPWTGSFNACGGLQRVNFPPDTLISSLSAVT